MMANVQVGWWSSKSDITTGLSDGLSLSVFNNAMENTIVTLICSYSQKCLAE